MYKIITFIVFCVGVHMLFGLNLKQISGNIFDYIMSDTYKKKGIKSQVYLLRGKKNENIIKKQILETERMLRISRRENKISFIFGISLIFSVIGILIASTFQNIFLIPTLAVGFLLIPFWYFQISAETAKKEINEELEVSLSVITTTYLRNENIVKSVEEDLEYLNEPIKTFFKDFLFDVNSVGIENALYKLKGKLENSIFNEWCESLISCQSDRTLKATLMPIVEKLNDIRVMNSKSEAMYYSSRQEFFIMAIMAIFSIPVIKSIGQEFYDTLMTSNIGKISISIVAGTILISAYMVLRITRPLEYK